MELRDLRYFVAVAENLHFGRAAERLHMTQPALSRQIRALEVELEVQLFRRTKRSVQLTIAGQAFLKEARQILYQSEQAVSTTRRVARGEMGELRLSFTPSALRHVLPKIVRAFRDRYPDVQLTMTERCTLDQVEAFRASQIDVGFLYPPVDDKRLTITPLRTEPLVIALPQDYPLATRPHLKLSDLAAEPFILHPRLEGPYLYDQIIQLCEQAGFRPNVVQEAVASQTRIGLVAAGMGITFVPETLKDTVDSTVVYRKLKGVSLSLELAIARRQDNLSPIVQHFLNIVEEMLETFRLHLA
ncbi:MAG: LysR family transcriptional regulator [Cyanobacteria bacterium P01_G01_bin.38]